MMMTAVSACRPLRARRTSRPSMSGSLRSRSTRSGLTSSAVWRPSLPVPTPWTSIWSPASTREQRVRMFRSSSTTRMLSILPKIADIPAASPNFLPPRKPPLGVPERRLAYYRRDRTKERFALDISGQRAGPLLLDHLLPASEIAVSNGAVEVDDAFLEALEQ